MSDKGQKYSEERIASSTDSVEKTGYAYAKADPFTLHIKINPKPTKT